VTEFFSFTIIGVVTGAIYAIAATGLVVTYTTTGIFNFGHGALGMVMAFTFWQLSAAWGVPSWLSLILVLFVIAPLTGVLLERILFRRLHDAPVGVTLVVTVGLLVMMLGIGQTIWPGNVARNVPRFFEGSNIEVFNVFVSYHQISVLVAASLVAFGLRMLLFSTRLGVAMRAVVDNRELAAQNGALPEQIAGFSWAVGASLAALSGIFLAPTLTLSHIVLTLLVINGYAAAILGRLQSLPLTFVGAMCIGLAESYIIGYGPRWEFGEGWLGNEAVLLSLRPVIPVIFLFSILVFLPQARLRAGRIGVGVASPRVPDLRSSLRAAGAFLGAAFVASFFLNDVWLLNLSGGFVLGMVMLSLVLLSGYGGQVSLSQLVFVGIGAAVMGKMFPGGSVVGILVAGLVAAAIGALVALPALRLQDLYLALATFSVGLFAEKIIFNHPKLFDSGGNILFEPLQAGPISLAGDRAQYMVAVFGFAAFGVIVLAIRRGAFGRRLSAMSDSPAACATLGMNILGTKVAVFAVSAFLAGSAGALFGTVRSSAGSLDFGVIQSLFIYLLVTIGGITSVTGAFIGGVVVTILPEIQTRYLPDVDLQGLFIGVGAIVVSRYPNGFAGVIFDRYAAWKHRRAAVGDEDVPVGLSASSESDVSDVALAAGSR